MNTLFILLQNQPQKPGAMSWIIMILIFVVFYVLIMLPQSRRQKQLRKFRESLQEGQKVKTVGGIYGKIAQIKDDGTLLLEVDTNTRIKVDLGSVVDASEPQQKK